ncbi:conserved hypothetical protein [Flavobacterium sp. 9AF]|uniref:hypothetical protein n=1 Tax=Flavobacterium sp. 9AF TaxID=2653142 RepID=UPI0012F21AAC|nr:hypothetical protein [Flavobacterium sp. 9AF]VXC17003.1 conserved hypothetical protein [Flavobacterium sp. 9AF]
MKTYQSCGKISLENNTVIVKTALPTLEEGVYKYVRYYNISNENYFGILGILYVENGPNKDLTEVTGELRKVQVDAKPINLKDLKPLNSGKSFTELKSSDVIHFMCFHDDSFNLSDHYLLAFQESLPNFPDFDLIEEPKVGNGGVLTFEGCS